MRRGVAGVAALALVGGLAAVAAPQADEPAVAAQRAAMPFDFDGDGYADLAVGVPGEDLRGRRDVGAVQVMYGAASGVTARDQLWHQGRRGVKGALERGDQFGQALASGDFDADGYADLAIGIPRENIGRRVDAGAVQVLYGAPGRLTARDQIWHQGKRGVPGANESGDRFGETLAVGDFDGDGYADLAIGSPFEDLGRTKDAGTVVVLRGTSKGLKSAGARAWNERSPGIGGTPVAGWQVGAELAAGDVTGDGRDDLVVGARGGSGQAASARVLLGSPGGLTPVGSSSFLLAGLGLGSGLSSLWLGDVNADGRADLTVSAYGGVGVLHGYADGLRPPTPLGAPGQPGVDARWTNDATGAGYGGPAVTGDVTGDGFADLLMRVERGQGDFGLLIVLGTAQGLGAGSEEWMWWGSELTLLPLSGGTTMWPVFGASTLSVGPYGAAGSVTVINRAPAGTGGTATMWSQDSPGIKGGSEPGDYFGQALG